MRPQHSRPRVVVGISTFNRADILPKALDSALNQSYPRLEVSVLDDASTDATPDIAASYPQIKWTRRNRNEGLISARNFMMLSSEDDYYVSLDDDAWFLRGDEIEVAVEILEQDKDIAAVAFDILSPEHSSVVPRRPFVQEAMFIGCGHVLRLATVRQLHGYAKFPGAYGGEEKDFCLRLLDAGYHIVRTPGVHVWHDKTPLARDVPRQYRSVVSNDFALTVRRTPILLLPMALVWKAVRHLQFSIRARLFVSFIYGLKTFLISFPEVWRGRGPVRIGTLQRFRKLSQSHIK